MSKHFAAPLGLDEGHLHFASVEDTDPLLSRVRGERLLGETTVAKHGGLYIVSSRRTAIVCALDQIGRDVRNVEVILLHDRAHLTGGIVVPLKPAVARALDVCQLDGEDFLAVDRGCWTVVGLEHFSDARRSKFLYRLAAWQIDSGR